MVLYALIAEREKGIFPGTHINKSLWAEEYTDTCTQLSASFTAADSTF